MDKEIFGIVFGIVFFLGGVGFLAFNSETKQRECRMELAKELKLDPANILLICGGK